MKKSTAKIIVAVLVLNLGASCSTMTTPSSDIVGSTAIGAVGGTAFGWLFSRENGDTMRNLLINGGIGAGTGLLAGALVHQRAEAVAAQRSVVKRQAQALNESQKEIDRLREQVDEGSSWGRNEVRSFDERYVTDTSSEPYMGIR